MKKITLFLVVIVITLPLHSQIGAEAVFALPSLTDAEMLSVVTPTTGSLTYNTTQGRLYFYDGTQWQTVAEFDNLGDHTATQNIELDDNWLSNDGDNEGIRINDDGYVGIGTANPTSQLSLFGSTTGAATDFAVLHVRQNTGWSGAEPWALYVEGYSYFNGFRVNGQDAIRSVYLRTGQFGFATGDTSPITFTQSNSAERMRIHTNGFVGMGTNNPTVRLDVNGNARIRSIATGAASDEVLTADANGNIRKVTMASLNDGDAWGVTGEDIASTISRTGNVGIGSTTPVSQFEVASANRTGTHTPGDTFYVTGSYGQRSNGAEFVHTNGTRGIGFGWEGIYATGSAANSNISLNSKGTGVVDFYTNNTFRMRVNGAGNVGIGTGAPSTRLDVNGNARIRTIPTGAASDEVLTADTNGNIRKVTVASLGDGDAWGVTGENLTSAIKRSGRVDVGGTNTGFVRLNSGNGSNNGYMAIYQPSGTRQGYIGWGNGDMRYIAEAGGQHYFNSRVGIGTAAPGFLLHVSGRMKMDGGDAGTWIEAGANDWFFGRSGGNLRFFNAVDRVTITPAGRVGIGTTAPGYALDVRAGGVTSPNQARRYFSQGAALTANTSPSGNIKIYTNGWYYSNGGGYIAASDQRIKNIIGISNSEEDLSKLLAIDVVDYTYKDQISNSSTPQKKVIAQQLEKVLPHAVGKTTSIIPNVFEQARKTKALNNTTEITTTSKHMFKNGDKVRLIVKSSGEKEYIVTVKNDYVFEIPEVVTDGVFVYGKEVDDFRNVDYDAVSMLNVSATQELFKIIEQQQKEINNLNVLNAELKSDSHEMKNEITVLKEQMLMVLDKMN
ncbi:tail fiber domain-containing protein [Aquimarina sediminis]|uniref:tail fiber domain-containing protein n=1 Tax=Aquimarina sediminis TaxID=2070536 RepID=UPI000CA036E7|nr:tail fiber domain-containing protein [Aquimarina sediminis]